MSTMKSDAISAGRGAAVATSAPSEQAVRHFAAALRQRRPARHGDARDQSTGQTDDAAAQALSAGWPGCFGLFGQQRATPSADGAKADTGDTAQRTAMRDDQAMAAQQAAERALRLHGQLSAGLVAEQQQADADASRRQAAASRNDANAEATADADDAAKGAEANKASAAADAAAADAATTPVWAADPATSSLAASSALAGQMVASAAAPAAHTEATTAPAPSPAATVAQLAAQVLLATDGSTAAQVQVRHDILPGVEFQLHQEQGGWVVAFSVSAAASQALLQRCGGQLAETLARRLRTPVEVRVAARGASHASEEAVWRH